MSKHVLRFIYILFVLTVFMAALNIAVADEIYLWPIRVNGLWGYMNSGCEIVIPAQYDSVELFHDGRAVVHTQNGNGIINIDGAYLVKPQYGFEIEEYDHAYCIMDYERYAAGFYDKKSGFLQLPDTEYAMVMLWGEDGNGPIAVQNSDGLTGYVSRTDGSVIIPFQYTGESEYPAFREGFALVANNAIMMEGSDAWHEVLPGDEYSDEDYAEAVGFTFKQYLIDVNGNKVSFPDGIEPVTGVSRGIVIISSELTEEDKLSDEQYCFAKYGIARADGTTIMEPAKVYYMWGIADEDLICFVDDGCCGQMSASGDVVIPAIYNISTGGEMPGFWFSNGYAVLEDDGDDYSRYVVLKPDGTMVAELHPQGYNWYLKVSNVMNNQRLWVKSWHVGSVKMVNYVPRYDIDHVTIKLYSIENDELSIVSETSYESVSAGIQGIPCQTDDFSEGLQAVQMNSLWGFIDQNGTEVISYKWDAAGNFDHGLALVQKDGQLMYINRTGETVWEENKH